MPSRSARICTAIAVAACGLAAVAVAAGPTTNRSAPAPAPAHDPAGEVLDQENAPATLTWARCAVGGRGMYQSFRPGATPLSALALDFRYVPPGGDSIRVRLRAGSPSGRVLGEASAFVAGEGWVRFAFGEVIPVMLGHVYVIEWLGNGAWWACSDNAPYARGFAYNCGQQPLTFRDFNFRTYVPAAHWQAITWSGIRRLMAGGGGGQDRGSTSSRVDGGRAR